VARGLPLARTRGLESVEEFDRAQHGNRGKVNGGMLSFQGWHSPTFGSSSPGEFALRLASRRLGVFVPPYSAMSDLRVVLLSSLAYLLCIYVLRIRFPINKPPAFGRSRAFVMLAAWHNVALAFASLFMNVGISRVLLQMWREANLVHSVCNPMGERLNPGIARWMFYFYLSKFWELFDTVLLVLRGRPLTLLHVWHHASVPLQTFLWLELEMAVGAYGLWFNSFVHIFMYSYFAAALLKIRVPWKRYITALQIVQFVSSFLSLIPWAIANFGYPQSCTGNISLIVSAVMNAILLGLFVRFYRQTYLANSALVKSEKSKR
jgi:fatty acid elongase 3